MLLMPPHGSSSTFFRPARSNLEVVWLLSRKSPFHWPPRIDYRSPHMKAILLVWNPKKWAWTDLEAQVFAVRHKGKVREGWNVGNLRQVSVGTRVFLIRVGLEPKGIVGAGYSCSDDLMGPHWDPARKSKGEKANYIDINWDILAARPLVSWDELQMPPFDGHTWPVRISGTSIPEDVARALNSILKKRHGGVIQPIPEEIPDAKFTEGPRPRIIVNAYERNPRARTACLAHYGSCCAICGLSLSDRYGELVSGLIHIHHLTPVSRHRGRYRVDPVRDLRPICPNCHAVVHARTPPYTINKVRRMLRMANDCGD